VSLSVAVYYGAVKKRKEMHLTLHTYDIVLTSYGIRIILTKCIVFTKNFILNRVDDLK
jgi:hypothetical protein